MRTQTIATASNWQVERGEAIRAVATANTLARHVQASLTDNGVASKSDSSPVTVADYGVQCYIVNQLHNAFPNDFFIAEETSTALRENSALLTDVLNAVNEAAFHAGTPTLARSDITRVIDLCAHPGGDGQRTWVLDPIDGTRGYVARRQYCVALALIYKGKPVLGVLGCPNLPMDGITDSSSATGVLFHATVNEGTYMLAESDVQSAATPPPLGRRVRASTETDVTRASIAESVEVKHSSHEISGRVAEILGVKAQPMRMDSQAKYGCLSRGDAHVFLRFPRRGYVESIWDHAGGYICIREAGGRVTDGRGRDLDFSKGRFLDNDDGIVATNGAVHDAVIAAVQQAFKENATHDA